MYAVANEKNVNKYGVMEYEVFGTRLETLYNVREVLKKAQLLHVLDDENSIFNRALLGSLIDSVFLDCYNIKDSQKIDDSKKYRAVLPQKVKVMLGKFEKYFDTSSNKAETLYLTRSMLDSLKAFRALDYEIVQVTPKQKAFSKPYPSLMFYQNNLGISRRNAAILMFLTGKTYYNYQGEKYPIIINNEERTNVNWREIPCTSGTLKLLSRY